MSHVVEKVVIHVTQVICTPARTKTSKKKIFSALFLPYKEIIMKYFIKKVNRYQTSNHRSERNGPFNSRSPLPLLNPILAEGAFKAAHVFFLEY